MGEAARDLARRTVVAFAAAYYFSATFGFSLLGQPLWTVIRRFDDSAVALIPLGIYLLILAAALRIAFLTRGVPWEWFVVAMAVVGVLLDLAGLALFGLHSVVSQASFFIHISACALIAVITITRRWAKSAYLAGVLLVAYTFLATPANTCHVPGQILGAEYDPDRSAYMMVTKHGTRIESYIVVEKCVKQQDIPLSHVLSGYQSYNIMLVGGHYYGIRQGDGAFRLIKYLAGSYSQGVDAPSLEEVKQRIDALGPSLPPLPSDPVRSFALQLAGDYKGYNIIRRGDEFYGIRQADGAFSIERFNAGGYVDGIKATSLEEAFRQIDERAGPVPQLPPQLVEEGYHGYNIIQVGNRLFGILQADGAFEVERFQAGGYNKGVAGASIEEVKRLIHEAPEGSE